MQLARLPLVGVPSRGVTKVGVVARTIAPVPVNVLTDVPFNTSSGVVTLVVKMGFWTVAIVTGDVPVLAMLLPAVISELSDPQPIAKLVLLVLTRTSPVLPPAGIFVTTPPPTKVDKS